MQGRIILAAVVAFGAVVAAHAQDTEAQPSQVKSREQIRCELVNDCQPLPATRAWITRTGEVERAPRAPKAQVVTARRQTKIRQGAGTNRSDTIKPVKQSDLFINFASGSWEITDAAYEQANELYSALTPEEWGKYKIEIAGHTDAVGSASQNEALSQKRAQAVADMLAARGVKRSQLVVKGYGFRRPIDGLDRFDGRNRRVEIILAD